MSISIRPGRLEDHARLLAVWRSAVESSHTFLTASDVDWYEPMVAGYLQQMSDVRVAIDDSDEVMGFLAQDAGEIHMLFVDPAAQRRGVGGALLDDVAADHEDLRLDVNEQNPTLARSMQPRVSGRWAGRTSTAKADRFPFCTCVATASRSRTRHHALPPPARPGTRTIRRLTWAMSSSSTRQAA